jgi:hypothetical protein
MKIQNKLFKYLIINVLMINLVFAAQLTLTWTDNSNNENGFIVERANGTTNLVFTEVARVGSNVTSYVDANLPANTTYTYRVAAYNNAGNSLYSNAASGTTMAPPETPSNLKTTVTPGN